MHRSKTAICLVAGLCVVFLSVFFVASQTKTDFFAHSAHDSYTKQALAWRDGNLALDQDYPWLELAIYRDTYYVSFPPVPTLPMLMLTFFFGAETPNAFMTLLYFLCAYIAAYFLLSKMLPPHDAAVAGVFTMLGGSMLDIAVSGFGMAGAVWYQAQLLALLLTLLSFLLMESKHRLCKAASLILIALAVGCRPFNVLYVPWLLLRLYRNVSKETPLRRIRAMLPYIAIPALIAALYGAFNHARFGNPLEFGHSYLPEFVESGEPMFSVSYILQNIRQVFSLPSFQSGALSFPVFSGFAFYLTNPMLLFGAGHYIRRLLNTQIAEADSLLFLSLLLHIALLLSHRTNGGWQYGTRYLTDTIPAALFLFGKKRASISAPASLLMGALILFNVYGSILFHFL